MALLRIADGITTVGHILWTCVGLVVCYTIGVIFYNAFLHPLKDYPGPKLWATSRFPYLFSLLRGKMARDGLNLHRKYGQVVRIAPDELSYTNSQAWKDIYSQKRPEFHKDPMQLPKNPNGYPSLIGADRELHSRYRRLLSHPFSVKGLQEQEPNICRYVDLLIQRLHSTDHESLQDLVKWFNWITFDIIGDLAFGEPFSCLQNVETHPWVNAIYGNVQATPFINSFRRYGLFFLVELFLPKKMLALRKANFQYSSDKVEHRRSLGKDRGDFWDRILSESKDGKHEGMDHGEMTSNAATLVVAGSETTATLLSGAIYQLLKHPEMYRRLVTEVRTKFKSEKDIHFGTIGDFEYMEAVIDEALRIYPPVPMQPSRVAAGNGGMVCGKWVPGGVSFEQPPYYAVHNAEYTFRIILTFLKTIVSVQHYSATHMDSNWHRPEEFLPQRWLGDPEFADDDHFASQPFSFGPRACLGRNLGRTEARLILSKLLWNFDLELDEAKTGDWMNQRVYVLWEKPPLWVKLTPVKRQM